MIVAFMVGASCVLLHEFGHYLVFRACGVTPRVKIDSLGFEVGDAVDEAILTPRQLFSMLLSGITLGALPLLWHSNQWLLWGYLGCILSDVGLLFVVFKVPRGYWKRPYRVYLQHVSALTSSRTSFGGGSSERRIPNLSPEPPHNHKEGDLNGH